MSTLVFSNCRVFATRITLVIFFTLLMIAAANLRIPLFFTPVPVTLQTLVLFLSIIFLKNKAFLPQFLYIFLGFIGLPVFSNSGCGMVYLLGPTGGYLLGFLVAALITPYFFAAPRNFFMVFCAFMFCAAVYYFFGLFWLIRFHGFSVASAVNMGLVPFLGFDLLKISVATAVYFKIRSRLI